MSKFYSANLLSGKLTSTSHKSWQWCKVSTLPYCLSIQMPCLWQPQCVPPGLQTMWCYFLYWEHQTPALPQRRPLIGTWNRDTFYDMHYRYEHTLSFRSQCLGHLPTQMYLSLTAAIPRAKMALAVIEDMEWAPQTYTNAVIRVEYNVTCGCLWCVQCMPVHHNGSIRLKHLLNKHTFRI